MDARRPSTCTRAIALALTIIRRNLLECLSISLIPTQTHSLTCEKIQFEDMKLSFLINNSISQVLIVAVDITVDTVVPVVVDTAADMTVDTVVVDTAMDQDMTVDITVVVDTAVDMTVETVVVDTAVVPVDINLIKDVIKSEIVT